MHVLFSSVFYGTIFIPLVDDTRVKLLPYKNEEGSDYINGNYMMVMFPLLYCLLCLSQNIFCASLVVQSELPFHSKAALISPDIVTNEN